MSNHSCKGSPCTGKIWKLKNCGRENSRGKGGLWKKQAWLQEAGGKQWGGSRIEPGTQSHHLCSAPAAHLKTEKSLGRLEGGEKPL